MLKKVNVKINGIPNVCLNQRYLKSESRHVAIGKFGNVLANVIVREDSEGLVDRFGMLHLEADEVNEARSDLLAALDWVVGTMAEMSEDDAYSARNRRSRR